MGMFGLVKASVFFFFLLSSFVLLGSESDTTVYSDELLSYFERGINHEFYKELDGSNKQLEVFTNIYDASAIDTVVSFSYSSNTGRVYISGINEKSYLLDFKGCFNDAESTPFSADYYSKIVDMLAKAGLSEGGKKDKLIVQGIEYMMKVEFTLSESGRGFCIVYKDDGFV
ncbi:hypothetical protein [Roseivirga pacifica]|uniref:hypothetical protein n=1 Tax=Roseivirga pacifica TaxID=1267423 RepID=UPI003BAD89F9